MPNFKARGHSEDEKLARMHVRGLVAVLFVISCSKPTEVPDASAAPKPPEPVVAPKPQVDLDARYHDKPMLAVLEDYALAAIGQLPKGQELLLAPKVIHAFGGGDDWRATVRTTMKWPSNIDERIQYDWRLANERAALGPPPDAREFARAFADQYAK